MNRLDHLDALLACLRGEVPAGDPWIGVITMANQALCTPAVARRLKQAGQFVTLPADLRNFLEEILVRNEERNRLLYLQLDEAAALLNAIDIKPALLKGTAWLATVEAAFRSDRLLADLDIMVPQGTVRAAVAHLESAGYALLEPMVGQDVPVVLYRSSDAATIDLHTHYGSTGNLLYRHADLAAGGTTKRLSEGDVCIPSPAASVAILLLHDQLKGRDYLRGRIDLRHLLDIQALAVRFAPATWRELEALFASGYARSAAQTHLLCAERLLGLDVPATMTRSVRARLQFRRRMLQTRWPILALPATLLSLLDPEYLRARKTWRSAASAADKGPATSTWLPRRMSVERLLSWNEVGKI